MLRVEPEIKEQYVAAGDVRLAFHPMLDHGNASRLAHTAAECVGELSPLGFWQMHDLLFERQDELWRADVNLLSGWVDELGLDSSAFQMCMAEGNAAQKVETLDQARRDAGIRLRPTFDMNGQISEGAIPFAAFQQTLDSLLSQ